MIRKSLLFLLLWTAGTAPCFAIYAMLEANTVKEGGIIKIRIGNKYKIKAADVNFLGKKYPAFYQGYDIKEYEYVYTAMLPVPLDTKGRQEVKIFYRLFNNWSSEEIEKVTIKKLKTVVSELDTGGQLSKEMLAALRKENRVIAAAQKKVTAVKYKFPFIRPIEMDGKRIRETTGFGKTRIYDGGAAKWRHKGIDIGAPKGTPVRASNNGRVMVAQYGKGHGNMVVIDHGGAIHSLYYHLDKIYVKKGQNVSKGDIIAAVGSTGLSTGPHLHWQINLFKVPVNPIEFLTEF